MEDLQKQLLGWMAEHTAPEKLVARVIVQKLKTLGFKIATEHVDDIQAAVTQERNAPGAIEKAISRLQLEQSREVPKEIHISLEDSDADTIMATAQQEIATTIPKILDDLSSKKLKLLKRPSAKQREQRAEHAEFERRLRERWRKPLTLFRLEVESAIQLGGMANGWLRRRRRKKKAASVEAITRIHARACQVAAEVQALLRAGFADGAIARWRTLHELNVVAWLLLDKGEAVAERYVSHVHIDSLRAVRDFQKSAASSAGYDFISARHLKQLELRCTRLVTRFGSSFSNEYGWAAGAVKGTDPNFRQIEDAVNFSRFRPYYKLASGNVHAGPKGAFFRIGMLDSAQRILMAGPSNAGLDEAGRLAAMSLAQVTVALLQVEVTLDGLLFSKIMLGLADEVEAAFIAAQRKLEREDRAQQRARDTRKSTRRTPRRRA